MNAFKVTIGIFAVVCVLIVLWFVSFGMKVVGNSADTATGVVDKVINADHALQSYRWFHEANQQIKAKVEQIDLSKNALAATNEDRKEARRVELLGLQQGCQTLVSEYNARAMRADTVIFKHPEKFLPGDWPGDRNPLPDNINLSVCR